MNYTAKVCEVFQCLSALKQKETEGQRIKGRGKERRGGMKK